MNLNHLVDIGDMASASSGFSNANTYTHCTCSCGVLVIMLTSNTKRNPNRRFLQCPYFRDPAKCCKFFRWVDPGSEMKVAAVSKDESRIEVEDKTQILPFHHDDIVVDIGEVVQCVADLREIQLAEMNEIKQMQKLTIDELKGEWQHLKEILVVGDVELKEAFAKRDMEVLKLKRAMVLIIVIVSIVLFHNFYMYML